MKIRILISIFLTILLTGCGQGFDILSLEKDVGKQEAELTEIEKASIDEIGSLEQEIAALEAINFDEFTDADLNLFTLNKVKKALGTKLDGILDRLDDFRLRLDELRQKINGYIVILDPNDPNQKKIMERLQELLARVDQVESILDRVEDLLRNKLSIIDDIFDRLKDRLDPTNPVHSLIGIAIDAIRDMIKSKLGI